MEKYRAAEIEDPSRPEIKYNMGNVYYRLGKYDEAIENYNGALYSKDKNIQKDSYYNTGNAYFRQQNCRQDEE